MENPPLLRKLARSLADFLFPKKRKVIELESLSSARLLEMLPPSESLGEDTLSLFDYGSSLVKELIWEVKYKGNRSVADKMGEMLYDFIISELEDRSAFEKFGSVVLMPMPVSDKRRFERGWNQAELLCSRIKSLDSLGRLKYLERMLCKVRHTESQTRTASRKERERNLSGSMKVLNPRSVEDRLVVLVDDVVTTGSTFREARRALKEAGAKKIICVALAH